MYLELFSSQTNKMVRGIKLLNVHLNLVSYTSVQFEKPGRRENFDYPQMALEAGNKLCFHKSDITTWMNPVVHEQISMVPISTEKWESIFPIREKSENFEHTGKVRDIYTKCFNWAVFVNIDQVFSFQGHLVSKYLGLKIVLICVEFL